MNPDDFMLAMYQEHVTQGRQHEILRERAAALTVATAAALLAFIAHDGIHPDDCPLGWALVVLGILGAAVSLKHYERNRLHVSIAGALRNALDSSLGAGVGTIRDTAEKAHDQKHPLFHRVRLYAVWSLLISSLA